MRFADPEMIRKSEERAKMLTRLEWAAAGAGLVFLVLMCILTRTGNARAMVTATMAGTVVWGLGILAFRQLVSEKARAESRHLKNLAEKERTVRTGRITADPEEFRIPKSIRAVKVSLDTGEETLALTLNAKYFPRLPGDGSLVRAETAGKFITAMEILETADGGFPRKSPSAWRNFRREFGRFFPGAVVWSLTAVLVTGFIFTRITDTDPAHKITIYADCPLEKGPELAEKLEQGMEGAVRMVKVHPFSFALFGSEQLKSADLYIVPDSRKAEYADWLGEETGTVMADPAGGKTVAGEYFRYFDTGETPSVFRLYYGGKSVHREDGLAEKAAELLAGTNTEKEGTP